MYSPAIQKLIEQFSKFPTIGPRTAARFVFYLLKLAPQDLEEITKTISQLKTKVKLCSFCFKPFEPSASSGQEDNLCEICSNESRDKTLLCVIEKETDLETIEKTKKYQGRYFILGGNVSKLKKEDIHKLRTEELIKRIKDYGIKEIILATNATAEGESTALYLERLLKPLNIKTTRLGRGLPVGSELEYADEETLASALDNRK